MRRLLTSDGLVSSTRSGKKPKFCAGRLCHEDECRRLDEAGRATIRALGVSFLVQTKHESAEDGRHDDVV